MIYCKEHPTSGTTIKQKGPHIGVYCTHCNKWLKWIKLKDIAICATPIQYVENDTSTLTAEDIENELPW